MNSVIPKLVEAENTVDEIKNSYEWKRSFNYFQTLYNRGQLRERPTKANGYKIIPGPNLVKLSDIEDILTPDQLSAIIERVSADKGD
jgi:hypothetical protein